MPTVDQLQAELLRLRLEVESNQRLYIQEQRVASGAAKSLEEANNKYRATLQNARIQSQKDADLALTAATSETMTQAQKDAALAIAKSNMELTAQSLNDAAKNVKSAKEVNKIYQEGLGKAKKNLDQANVDYKNKQAQLTAQQELEKQKVTSQEQEKKNQDIDKTSGQIDAKIDEFKKSATGLNDFNPDAGCKNINAPCTECHSYVSAAQEACQNYDNAKIEYERAKQNTIKVAKENSSNQAELSGEIRNDINKLAAYNKSISAGISLLKDMARDGSTQDQRNRLQKNILENQNLADALNSSIKNIKGQIAKSQKEIEDAQTAEETAKKNVRQKNDEARLALAELASCSLKCQKSIIRGSKNSTDEEIKTKGSLVESGSSTSSSGSSFSGSSSGKVSGTGSSISSTSTIRTLTFKDEGWMRDNPFTTQTYDYLLAFPNSYFAAEWLSFPGSIVTREWLKHHADQTGQSRAYDDRFANDLRHEGPRS